MLPRIVRARYQGEYRIEVAFNTGESGVIDFGRDAASWSGVLEPLRDAAFFAQVFVDRESGTLAWPGEIDLDPDVLYSRVTGAPLPEFAR
jgi:hypothetical protein